MINSICTISEENVSAAYMSAIILGCHVTVTFDVFVLLVHSELFICYYLGNNIYIYSIYIYIYIIFY